LYEEIGIDLIEKSRLDNRVREYRSKKNFTALATEYITNVPKIKGVTREYHTQKIRRRDKCDNSIICVTAR